MGEGNSARSWTGLAAINVAAVIFGTTALFGKLPVAPVWIVAGRAVAASVTLLALGLALRASLRVTGASLARIAATGVILATHWVTFFMSVQMADVAVATLTFATFPFMTILMDAGLRKRVPTTIELGAGLAIVAAVALLVGPGLPKTATAPAGAAVGLLSAACFAVFSVASQRLGARVHPIALSLYQNLTVGLVLAGFLPFTRPMPHGLQWGVIAVLGVVATALMHQLYFFSLKRLSAAVCGGFVALEPVYAIVFAAILFAEPIGPMVIVSGVLIVGASMLLLTRTRAEALAP